MSVIPGRPWLALFLWIGSLAEVGAESPVVLVRTAVEEGRVCGLSGNWLKIPDEISPGVRAWVGIVQYPDGGPGAALIRHRHQLWLQHAWSEDASAPPGSQELDARRRHCRQIEPRFFDGVLVERSNQNRNSDATFYWVVDTDIDQNLDDEAIEWVTWNDTSTATDDHCNAAVLIELHRDADHGRLHVSTFHPKRSAEQNEHAETPRSSAAPLLQPSPDDQSKSLRDVPAVVGKSYEKLLKLDDATVRKEHLNAVVDAADVTLDHIDQWQTPADANAAARRELKAEVLYRRARALGYMELPDVVQVHPITDQRWIDDQFEATFQLLEQEVDLTDPQYILLTIRRERRRGNRGAALDLVDVYRRKHPEPVWYHKKRLDLMAELGAAYHAHQTACRMWLQGEKP